MGVYMQYFCLSILLIINAIHLYNCYIGRDSIRTHTKGFLMPFLLSYYLVLCSVYSIKFETLLFFVLIASWVGDVMLLRTKFCYFLIGGISFFVAHLCFIPLYYIYIDWSCVEFSVLYVASIIYVIISFIMFYTLNKSLPQPFFYGVLIYLLANGAMNVFALAFAFSNRNLSGILVLIGSISFYCSDVVLFLVRFHQKSAVFRGHFVIMATYILAEFLIVQGIFIRQYVF